MCLCLGLQVVGKSGVAMANGEVVVVGRELKIEQLERIAAVNGNQVRKELTPGKLIKLLLLIDHLVLVHIYQPEIQLIVNAAEHVPGKRECALKTFRNRDLAYGRSLSRSNVPLLHPQFFVVKNYRAGIRVEVGVVRAACVNAKQVG